MKKKDIVYEKGYFRQNLSFRVMQVILLILIAQIVMNVYPAGWVCGKVWAAESIYEDTDASSSGVSASAETDTGTEASDSENADALAATINSWRYSDGEWINGPDTDTDGTSGSTSYSLLSTTKYSTWKKSYGTSYYGLTTEEDEDDSSETVKVKVSGVVRVGIDVSKYQGTIDWEKVAAAGIDFAIIRCGYGDDDEEDDAYFLQNVEGALAAGLEIGVYLHSAATQATGSSDSAQSEAAHVLRLLEEAGLTPEDLMMPVFLDMEDDVQVDLDAETLGDIAETFCNLIEQQGYAVGIYANLNWWTNYLTDSRFTENEWYIWAARYPSKSSMTTSGVEDTNIWQFTSHGTVPGISTYVDVDFDYSGSGTYVCSIPRQVTLSSVKVGSSYTYVKLKWEMVSNAIGYEIYRAEGDGSYTKIAVIDDISTTSYKDTDISVSTTYKYKIRAYRDTGSETVKGTFSSAKTVTTGPGNVTIASLKMTNAGNIKITWEEVEDADGYVIYRSVDGGSYSKLKTITSGDTLSYTNKSVEAGTVYRYKIRAYIEVDGEKIYSPSYSNTKKMTARPAKVSIISAKRTAAGYIKVKWEEVEDADGYVIYRSKNGGSYKKVKTITSGSTLSWTDTSVTAGRVYQYKIKAYVTVQDTDYKSSSYSSVVEATAKPATVTITSVTSTKTASGTVKWESLDGVTGYQVAYRISGSDKWYYTTVTANKKVFTNMNHKKYYVKVRAYRTYNGKKYYGSWSEEVYMKLQ